MQTNRNLPDSGQFPSSDGDSEISLLDILIFLKGAWKSIVLMGLLGLAISATYLLLTPNQFEAVANVAMGRIPSSAVNIEEPVALINRMSLPSSFDAAVIASCGLQDSGNLATQLSKSIKLSIPKGVVNVIELKVTRPSPELAQACATSVFDGIAKSQTQMIGPLAEANKTRNSDRLVKVQDRLAQDKALLSKAEQPRGVLSPTYFSILTEIRTLEDERDKLSASIDVMGVQSANLQSPIYVADKPVYPKKLISLLAGLIGGLFLGLLIALGRQMMAKLKSEAGGVL